MSPCPHLALQELSQLSTGFCCMRTPGWSRGAPKPSSHSSSDIRGDLSFCKLNHGLHQGPNTRNAAFGLTHTEKQHPCSPSRGQKRVCQQTAGTE